MLILAVHVLAIEFWLVIVFWYNVVYLKVLHVLFNAFQGVLATETRSHRCFSRSLSAHHCNSPG